MYEFIFNKNADRQAVVSERPGRFFLLLSTLTKAARKFYASSHCTVSFLLLCHYYTICQWFRKYKNATCYISIWRNTANYYERGSVFHRAALQRRYFHRGYLLLLRAEPQLFQQGVPRYHGRKPTGVPAALPHGTGGTAADRKPPSHPHHQHHGQLSQSASLFPCVQKRIWHQPTGLSCKASCTIKIGLILRYTPFVFPTYKNAPFVRPNTVGQMGCCSFRDAPCFFILPLIF